MSGETVWQRDESWVGAEVEDSFVMVNIDSGKYVSLNVTANAVWQALETPATTQAIEQAVLNRFAVDEDQCRHSVGALLAQMQATGLAAPR